MRQTDISPPSLNLRLTIVHIVDSAEGVNPAAHDTVLPVQHPSPSSSPVPVASGLLSDLAVNFSCSRSLRHRLQLHAELDEAAHQLCLINR